jgi:hypothetical protein
VAGDGGRCAGRVEVATVSKAIDAMERMFARWECEVTREGRDPVVDYGCERDADGALIWWMPERAFSWLLGMELR